MKSISILAFLAIAICPISSHPHKTVTSNTPTSTSITSQSSSVPSVCNEPHMTISDQLAEIAYLKSKNLPITHDLAGYYYVILIARKMIGCPSISPINSNASSSTSSPQPSKRSSEPRSASPCSVVIALRTQVEEQMKVMEENDIGTPDYLAGWFSGTHDMNQGSNCGLPPNPAETGNHTSTVSGEE